MTLDIAMAKLRGLQEYALGLLKDKRWELYDPRRFTDTFERFAALRDHLRTHYNAVFGDLPVRDYPRIVAGTDFDGRGCIPRSELEALLADINYCLLVIGQVDQPTVTTETTNIAEAVPRVVSLALRRFHSAARALANRPREEKRAKSYVIEDEYDVQDLLFAMLKPIIADLEREDPVSKTAGDSGRVDLSSRSLGLVIEVKFPKSEGRAREIPRECSERIVLYSRWPELRHLVFFVYDPSCRIPDADNFIAGLSSPSTRWGEKELSVTAIVSPWEMTQVPSPKPVSPSLPEAKPDPERGAEDTLLVRVGQAFCTTEVGAVVVPVSLSNRSEQPNTIEDVTLVLNERTVKASHPGGGLLLGDLAWMAASDLRLDTWASITGGWYFGPSKVDPRPLRLSGPTEGKLRLNFVRGGTEEIDLVIVPYAAVKDLREHWQSPKLVTEEPRSRETPWQQYGPESVTRPALDEYPVIRVSVRVRNAGAKSAESCSAVAVIPDGEEKLSWGSNGSTRSTVSIAPGGYEDVILAEMHPGGDKVLAWIGGKRMKGSRGEHIPMKLRLVCNNAMTPVEKDLVIRFEYPF